MKLFPWIDLGKGLSIIKDTINQIKCPDYNNIQCNKKIYFSKSDISKIDDEFFLEHDGYFTKLVINQKLIGYIFRCVHKNVELVTEDNKKRVIPFLVTCFYQPMIAHTKHSYIKTLGKDQALKSGIRAIKQYVSMNNDLNLSYFKDNNMELNKIFKKDDLCFLNLSEQDYDKLMSYINTFDEKVYKYYFDIKKEDIVKIWIKK